jgi:hypothetical protein
MRDFRHRGVAQGFLKESTVARFWERLPTNPIDTLESQDVRFVIVSLPFLELALIHR